MKLFRWIARVLRRSPMRIVRTPDYVKEMRRQHEEHLRLQAKLLAETIGEK